MLRSARKTVYFAAFLAAASISCGREITGPGAVRTSGPLSFAPRFPAALRTSGGGLSDLVAFERVRVLFRRSDGGVAFDKTFDFPSNADSLPVTLNVPLSAGATEAGEMLALSMFYVDAANDTVFTGGPISVSVRPSRPGDPAPQPIPVTLRYTGPGEEAVRVVLSPTSATVTAGQTRTFTTQAFDQFNTPVQAPVIFESTDLSVVTVNDAGVATALNRRAGAFIIAKLYSDQADTSAVSVVLPASRMAASSGTGQSGPAGTALTQNVVVLVTASDSVPVAGVAVAFAASSGGAPGAATVITTASGFATTTWTLGNTVGAQALTATVAGLTGSPLSFTATATPGVPSAIVFTTQPSTVTAGAAIAPAVVVEVRTSGGTLAAGFSDSVSITIGTNPAAGTLGGVRTVAAVNGVATFGGLTLDRAGAGYTLVANSGALNAATSGAFAVNAAAAAALQFTVQPIGSTPGVALIPAPAVRAVDAFGNAATLTGNVTIAIGANPGGTTLGGTITQAAIANVATFPGLTLGAPGIGYTLVASSGALTAAASTAFDIGSAAATQLVFSTPPTDVVAGAAIAPTVVVEARTAGNQLDAGFDGSVTIAIGTNPGAGTLGGTRTVAAVNGTATFPGLTLDRSAVGYTLTASSGALTPASSGSFWVRAAAAAALDFLVQPTTSVAGVALAPTLDVRAVDAFGNEALMSASVTITIGANPGGATLGGTTSKAPDENFTSFSDLTLDRAAAGYTLVASSGALTAATSGTFTVTAAAPAALQFTVQPAGGTTGVAIAPPPAVRAVDAFGNPATFTGNVTIAIGANPGATTLGGTTTRGAVGDIATFNDLTLGAIGSGYTLVAAATGLTGVTSDPFNIGAAVMSWVNPSGGNWSVAANWNLNRVPNASDVVEISLGGTYTVTLDVNANVAGLEIGTGASGTQTLAMTGRTFTVAGNVQVGTRGALSVTTSSVVGTGAVVNSGTMTLSGSSLALALDNQGTLISSASSTITGALTTSAGSVLRVGQVDGASGLATLTVATGFTNLGAIELTVVFNAAYNAQLTVTTGTLVNAVGGTITTLAGTQGGGTRTIAAVLDNQGTITAAVSLALSQPSADHLNSGTINLTGGNVTVTQSGTTPSFTHTGTLTIGAGRTFTVSGGTFTSQASATLSGATLALTGVTAAFNGATPAVTGFSLTNTTATFASPVSSAATAFTLSNATLNGAGPFTNAVGQTLTLNGSDLNMPVDNQGTLISSASSTITGALTTSAGSVLRVGQVDGASGLATLTVATGFTNLGAIELTVVFNAAYNAQLTVTTGTLVNAVGGTITTLAGTQGGGTRTIAAVLDNQGTITAAVSLALSQPSADHLNSGTINLTGGNVTVTQSGTTPSFTHTGTLTIGAGRTFTVSGGTFTSQASATLSGATLALTGVTAAFNGATPAVTGFSLTNTTATFASPVSSAATAFTLSNATLNGAGPFTNAVGQTLTLNGSDLNMPVDNQGTLISSASSTITGALTTSAGSVLRVGQVDGASGLATLTVATGFTNLGAIELTVVFNAAYNAQLTVTSGTLVNAVGGTITTLAGTLGGGTRTIAAVLDNQGTITAAVSLALSQPSADHLNSGTINLTGGNVTVTQSGTTPSFTHTGTLTIGAGRTFTVSGGTFTSQASATLSGATLALTGVTAAFNGATPAVTGFSLTNTTATFASPVSSAATAFTLSNATLNGAGPFTNAVGQTLTLNGSDLNMPVDNQGTLISSASSTITGALTTSAGSVLRVGQVDGASGLATLTVATGFTNLGAIELTVVFNAAYNAQLTVTSGTLVNAVGGTITTLAGTLGGGTRTIAAVLDNQGTITAAVSLALSQPSADHLNSGTINLTGGNVTVTQSGTTPSFTHTGTLTIGAGRTFTVSGGTFTSQASATLSGATLALTGVTAAFNGATPAVTGFSLTNTTATFASPVSSAATAFTLSNATLNGAGPFTNAVGQTLTLNGSDLNMPVDNQGTLISSASSTITGALTTSAGSVLRVGQVDGASGLATLTVATGFTNLGAIELTVVFNAAYNAQLTVTTGTLVNAVGGTITTLNGTVGGGTRTIAAALDNQGTLTVGPGTAGRLTVSGSLTNSGTINLEIGGTTAATQFDQIVVTGTPSSATLGGTLNVSLINAFTPASANLFLILTTGTGVLSGTFATPNLPASLTTPPTYTGSGVTLVAP